LIPPEGAGTRWAQVATVARPSRAWVGVLATVHRPAVRSRKTPRAVGEIAERVAFGASPAVALRPGDILGLKLSTRIRTTPTARMLRTPATQSREQYVSGGCHGVRDGNVSADDNRRQARQVRHRRAASDRCSSCHG
jgi:hypothetical protein